MRRTLLCTLWLTAVLAAVASATAQAATACATDSDGDGVLDWLNDLACTGPGDNDEGLPTGTLVNGWTVVHKSSDTRRIYVSASGNDGNSGTEVTHPLRTVAAGLSRMRANMPDWLLLRRGDSFSGGVDVAISGRSAAEPLVIASYAESAASTQARPTLSDTISINGCSHVAVIHVGVVQAITPPYGGDNGAEVNAASDVLIEGCRFQGGASGLVFGGTGMTSQSNLRARRNVIYEPNADPVFIAGTKTVLLEENVLYNPLSTYPNGDRHGMYIARAGNSDVSAVGNLVFLDPALDSGNGIMMRPGGIARGNVVVGADWSAIPLGACNDGGSDCTGSNGPAVIDGNLVLDTVTQANYALIADPAYVTGPVQITNNIVLRVTGNGGNGVAAGGDGSVLSGNVFVDAPVSFTYPGRGITWRGNLLYGTTSAQLVNADALAAYRDFAGLANAYYSIGAPAGRWFSDPSLVSFAQWTQDLAALGVAPNEVGSTATAFTLQNPSCSLATYNASLGGVASTKDFFRLAASQAKYGYDSRYSAAAAIAYVRAGLSPIAVVSSSGISVPATGLDHVILLGAALLLLGLRRRGQ